MSKLILLDTGPLGIFSNPGKSQIISDCRAWAEKHQQHGNVLVVPEIADYEVRRELLRAGKSSGLDRLDLIKSTFAYLSPSFPVAEVRNIEAVGVPPVPALGRKET